ncbi:hypothetical protein LTR93_012069 [Exophiala xenobiotica]|nr:hypothetical protein LTR93_012069 [Exophiala xenobiotica]
MVTTITPSQIETANSQIKDGGVPRVSVFVGGTAGIGKAALKALASRDLSMKIYLVGRKEKEGKSIIDEIHKLNSKAEIIWLGGEISLMSETKRLVQLIKQQEKTIDLLFLSAGFLPFRAREETSEGVELALAVAYYSRMSFIMQLLLLMRTASPNSRSYPPRIVNVLAPGRESDNIFLDDLMLKKPGAYNLLNWAVHSVTMTTSTLSALAKQAENDGVTFIHAHPGVVKTDLVKNSWGDEWKSSMEHPNLPESSPRLSAEESGQRSLFLITNAMYSGEEQGGSFLSVDSNMACLDQQELFKKLEAVGAPDIIWGQTMEILGPSLA